MLSKFKHFVVRRRIAVSLVCFTTLIVFNLAVLRTNPMNPFDFRSPWAIIGTLLVLSGLAFRSWAAGTLVKSSELTTDGPYAVVRNPLYLGSFLMMIGFCILLRDMLSLAFILGPIVLLYYWQIRAEEHNLAIWYPKQWPAYAASTPRFIPRIRVANYSGRWSSLRWTRNREYQAALAVGFALVGIALWHQMVR